MLFARLYKTYNESRYSIPSRKQRLEVWLIKKLFSARLELAEQARRYRHETDIYRREAAMYETEYKKCKALLTEFRNV